jgi:hypothetical protein
VKTAGKSASVAVQVDGRKMPPGKKALQSYMEGTKHPWRHPVYGKTEVWVTQKPKPYFFKTVRVLGPASRLAVTRVVRSVAKDIT